MLDIQMIINIGLGDLGVLRTDFLSSEIEVELEL